MQLNPTLAYLFLFQIICPFVTLKYLFLIFNFFLDFLIFQKGIIFFLSKRTLQDLISTLKCILIKALYHYIAPKVSLNFIT